MALIDSLLAYWKMDEGSGNIIDAHGSNDGTAAGNPTYGQTGIINDAIAFDGTGDYFDVGKIGNLGSNMGDGFSMSFWIKTTSSAKDSIMTEEDTQDLLMIAINADVNTATDAGKIVVWYRDNSGTSLRAALTNDNNDFRDGDWAHVVVTIDPGNDAITIYIDGNSQALTYGVQGTPSDHVNWTYDLFLGAFNWFGSALGTWDFTGELDEVGIWQKILSQAEVTELWNSGAGLAYPFGAPPAVAGSSMRINVGDVWKDIAPAIPITITASADDTDVSGINVLLIDPAAAVSIGAFVGGVVGQVLNVVIIDDDQDVKIEHNKGTGNQNIFIHAGADETLDSHYGGWIFVCDGSDWYGTAHEKHS